MDIGEHWTDIPSGVGGRGSGVEEKKGKNGFFAAGFGRLGLAAERSAAASKRSQNRAHAVATAIPFFTPDPRLPTPDRRAPTGTMVSNLLPSPSASLLPPPPRYGQ